MSSIVLYVDNCQVVSAGKREFQERDPNTKAPIGDKREWHSLEVSYEGGKLNINYEPSEEVLKDPKKDPYLEFVGKRVSGTLAVRQNKSALYVDRILGLQVEPAKPAGQQGSKA
jgi:hypothetical protein